VGLKEIDLSEPQAEAGPRVRSRLASVLDFVSTRIVLRHSALGREIRAFARELEAHIFPSVRSGEGTDAAVGLTVNDEGRSVSLGVGGDEDGLGSYPHLREFLEGLGVRRLEMDADLESNQVADVLEVTWRARRALRGGASTWWDRALGSNKLRDALVGEEGLHIACADAYRDTDEEVLAIRNSYCPLTFSRAVTAYKQRVSQFRDHRAFFHAAPKYAVAMALVALVPTLAVALTRPSPLIIVAVELLVAALIGFGTLVLFETIGAVEYDKEYQQKQLRRRNEALIYALDQIETDLDRARRIQENLIPGQGEQPFVEHVHIAHSFVPETAVGGDYFDFRSLDDHRVAMLFADVSGHGMAGAFITGLLKTTFELSDEVTGSPPPFMRRANAILSELTPSDSFAAIIYAVYDIESHMLYYTNAGHNPLPMVVRAADGSIDTLSGANGVIAGVSEQVEYEETDVRLEPGDKLVLCTDGIIEGMDEDGELFGTARLHDVLAPLADRPALVVPDYILRALADHVGDAPQGDDLTILVMEVLK
jgi:serine phosphatase RsbU (regulator of sigma subunit)